MKNILVVDNNPLMLEFMSELLNNNGYNVCTASSGLEALHQVKRDTPDALFIDLVMPQIDGKQLCKLFRADPKLNNSRIIITSGIAAEGKAGNHTPWADAYIAKAPFKTMKTHILKVLDDFESGKELHYQDAVLGSDSLYKREITNELLYSKHHLEVLISQLDDGLVEITTGGEIIYVNPRACTLTGMEEVNLITRSFPSLFTAHDSTRIEKILDTIGGQAVIAGEEEPFTIDNKHLLLRFLPINYDEYHSYSVIIQDITERKKAEKVIRDSLHKKETLLREVHHRVKNNLTVIASLLNLQSSHIDDEEVKKHLIDSRNRVESMALVHERLYISEDLSGIDIKSYFEGIIGQLIEVYCSPEPSISYKVSMPELTGTMELAVPLGLIINEVVSNSLEHAFIYEELMRKAEIRVVFEKLEAMYHIHVSDNGIGLPEDFEEGEDESSGTLGLLLARTLSEQIHGSFTLKGGGNGVTAEITFPVYIWEDKLSLQANAEQAD